MGKNKKQLSRKRLVMIISATLLAAGLIFSIFYFNPFKLNFGNKKSDTGASSANSTKVAAGDLDLSETVSDESGTKFAIKYPKSWTLSHDKTAATDEMGASDISVVTSPDKTTSVLLSVMRPAGVQNPCKDATKEIKVVEKSEIDGVSGLGFIQYNEADSNTYIGAYRLDAVKDKKDCSTYGNSRYLLGSDSGQPIVTVQTNAYNDVKSDNYIIAKRIILSLFKKD